ncbi:CpaF family protein [Demequina pelophila]|uniref:CpaF family protein n=1 Tax=Demequina pelophila TaxID=1638984 RepID=UPI000781750E|nr:ATPase, T2SS/T4P/T4SS family [Demequina pelophila]
MNDLAALDAVLALPGVTDVLINGPGEVWMDRGQGLEPVALDLGDAARVRALAVALAARGGRRLDDAEPVADARLPDGTRLHAVLPPVADGCALVSLRRPPPRAPDLATLVAAGTVPAELADVLRGLVTARVPLLATGATGVGKTTLVSSLLGLVDPAERIVLIEEAGELVPDHPHVVRLIERRPNVEGAGGVGLARLVREALRMRPDRVVLGECRGVELREVLAAANTGHRGGMSTLHADAATAVPARLGALGAMAGIPPRRLAEDVVHAFQVVLHLVRDERRRIAQVGRLEAQGARLVVRVALEADASGGCAYGPAWRGLVELAGFAREAA